MYEFIRSHQLNMMLELSSACFTMALLLLITKFLTRKRKWILIMMELIATTLLISDRCAYIYSGDVSATGYVMVRISNGLVFFLTSAIVLGFNMYLTDLLTAEGKMEKLPKRITFVNIISVIGMVLAIIAAFTGLYYSFDANNIYHRGPGFLISYIIPIVGPIIQCTVIVQYKEKFSRLIYIALVLYLVVPIICGIVQIFAYGLSIVNMAMVLVSIFLYVFTYLDVNEAVIRAHAIEMEQLDEDRKSIKRLFDQTATAFVAAMEKKDPYPPGHSAIAAEIAGRIAKSLGKEQDEIDEIYYAALLHNVGIMGIPDGVVENLDKLSPEQYEVFKKTPIISAEILSNITEYPILAEAARYGNEKYDGSGYPEGLKGEEIPEVARIMAVIDKYDVMTTKSKFSDPLPEPLVREEFIKESGISFDPQIADIIIDIIDTDAKDEGVAGVHLHNEIEKELECGKYRDKISSGIPVDNVTTTISFRCASNKKRPGDFSMPSIIVFDSYDKRVHSNPKSIKAYKYTEYGELWFDGHYISTDARNMEVTIEKIGDDVNWTKGKYVIMATKFEDHVKINMTDGHKDMEVTIALPDSSKFAEVAITGENCLISDITVERDEVETTEDDITRIAEAVSYIERMESDAPNLQIDNHRSAYTDGIEIKDYVDLAFHSMSLPASDLVWHCPYIVIFYSEDGTVGGPEYKEFALIKLNGEIDRSGIYAYNTFSMKRTGDFPGWNVWKETNKSGLEYEVSFTRKGSTVTLKTTNLGVEIQNVTSVTDGGDKIYAAITGDTVAITDIRIK